MKTIKNIDIILENFECFPVASKDIVLLDIGEIKTNKLDIKTTDSLKLILSERANRLGSIGKTKFFERMVKWQDITAIELFFEDGTSELIYADWDDDDDYENRYQETLVDENLYITIGKNLHIKEAFKEYLTGKNTNILKIHRSAIYGDN